MYFFLFLTRRSIPITTKCLQSFGIGQRGYGATVARLTPDQKVGSSNLSGFSSLELNSKDCMLDSCHAILSYDIWTIMNCAKTEKHKKELNAHQTAQTVASLLIYLHHVTSNAQMKSVSKWPKEHKINTQRLRRVTSTQRLRRVCLGSPNKDIRQNALLTFAFWTSSIWWTLSWRIYDRYQ